MKQSSAVFISKESISTFWFLLAAGAVIGTFYYLFDLVDKKGLRPQFIILNNPDVKMAVPERDIEVESEMVLSQTRLAMDSIFNKNSTGLDAAERCSELLSSDVWKWVQSELVEKQKDAFKEARIHQKVEVEKIDLRAQPDSDAVLASVQGQLLRVGILDDKLLNEVWTVRAEFMWVHNVNLKNSGRMPLLCVAFNCREKPISSNIRRTKAVDPDRIATEPESASSEQEKNSNP